jgi:hypothetical protein
MIGGSAARSVNPAPRGKVNSRPPDGRPWPAMRTARPRLLLGTGSYETPGSAEDGAGLFAAADVVATMVTGLVAACVGMSFAEALWT